MPNWTRWKRAVAQMSEQLTRSRRNLLRRPRSPAKGQGRVQRLARRALWALSEASTSEILKWTHGFKLHRGERLANWDSLTARRALKQIGAIKTGRAATIGRPMLWRMRDE
jgi:hypothetical protein